MIEQSTTVVDQIVRRVCDRMHKNFVFEMPDGSTVTSVVMDMDDFNEMCDFILEKIVRAGTTNVKTQQGLTETDVACIRAAKHVPMAQRGTKTQPLFDRYGVETRLMSVIVRGEGENLLRKLTQSEMN